jgi:hypothetical protein
LLLRCLALAAVLLHTRGVLHADGGIVRLSEHKGDYRITVFTSPTPLRAGTVDVSVFIQVAVTGEPVSAGRILVRVAPRGRPHEAVSYPATKEAATNKLFQAAVFDLSEPGWWDVEVVVEGLREPVELHFEMEAEDPIPRVWGLMPWIAWPALAILLFCVHQWLVRRKSH